ncbi:hypothetical protein D3C75_847110 [compost metagenome]
MTGRSQYFVVTFDLHVLDIGTQRAPQTVDHGQGCRIGLIQRRQDHLVPTEQLGVGGLDPTLLGTGNRMPRHEAWWHCAKCFSGSAHHVALGTTDIGQDRLPQVHASQTRKHFLHGQDRHRQLNDVGALTSNAQVFFAAIHHPQLDRELARLWIEIDPDHFATHPAFAQPLGKRTADQPQTDHHQATDHRFSRLQCSDINHEPEPWSAHPGSGCSLPADQW